MKDYTKLKIFLLEKGIKRKELAKLLGIDESALSKKINLKNDADFNLDEVRIMCDKFNLEPKEYFFISKVVI